MPDPNPTVAALEAITDPVERAAACQTFLVNGRATIGLVEKLRTTAIREARSQAQALTIDELADRMRAKRHIVVDALRGQKEAHAS
jgi:hypothetical protein